jgi:hypothetical protein
MKYNRLDIKCWLVSTSFKIYIEILSNFYIPFTIFYYNTISLKRTFFPVLVKGLSNRIIQFTCNAVSTHLNHRRIFLFSHVVVWGRYCACEILIANPINWLYAIQKLKNNMMNIVCQSCKQYLMHMTERIFNAPDG